MKNRILFSLVVFLPLTACVSPEAIGPLQGQMLLNAVIEENASKTTLLPDGTESYNSFWSANDSLGLFATEGDTPFGFALSDGVGTKSGHFSGPACTSPYTALYPYRMAQHRSGDIIYMELPAIQVYTPNSFGPNAYPMIAVSQTTTLPFMNLCAVLKLSVTGTATLNAIRLQSNGPNVFVSGPATVSTSYSDAPTLVMAPEASNSVTLQCDALRLNADNEISFYLVLPPQTYPKGFSLFFDCGDDSFQKDVLTQVTLERSTLYTLRPINLDALPNVSDIINPADSIGVPFFDIEDDEDYASSFETDKAVTITYSADGAIVDDPGGYVTASVDGAYVTITSTLKKVAFTLRGSSAAGMFKLYSDNKFRVILDGLSLTNPNGPALNFQKGIDGDKRAYVSIAAGSENTLSDGATYADSDEDQKGTVFSEGKLLLSGTGTLTVHGLNKHAVACDDYIRIMEGTLNIVQSVKDGLHANDGVYLEGGSVSILAGDDGIQAEEGNFEMSGGRLFITVDAQEAKAINSSMNVFISGGTLDLTANGNGGKAIKTDRYMMLSGGNTTLKVTGDGFYDSKKMDITSPSCINVDSSMVITGSTTVLHCTATGSAGKGISCDGDLTIEDGQITVSTSGKKCVYSTTIDSSPKAIKSDNNLWIKGGTLDITATGGEGSEGLESKNLMYLCGGQITLNTYDDCINAKNAIFINGGTIYAYCSNNDAIDSNGIITVTGGLILACAAGRPEGALDSDGFPITITGGTLLGIGGFNEARDALQVSQYTLAYKGTGTKGDYISLIAYDGTFVMGVELPRTYSNMGLIFSSPSLKGKTRYSLYKGGTITGTPWHFFYDTATYQEGSVICSFTTNSFYCPINGK